MNRLPPDGASIVRPAEDLAALAAQINAAHNAVEKAGRTTLENARKAGLALLKAKAQCGARKFKPWLEKNVQCSRAMAYNYMAIAQRWEEVSNVGQIRDALRLLTEDAPDPDEPTVPH